MKKILFSVIAITGVLFGFQSCNEEVDLIGGYTETVVVYGLLDQGNSIHMIKITRAFIGDNNTPATDIALIADSSYFESVEGTVTEYMNVDANGLPINPTGRVFQLMDTIVDNKDENGVFYAPEQKLYYFDNTKITATNTTGDPLNDDYIYKLDLDINNGAFQVSGHTELVKGMSTTLAGSTQPYRFVGAQNNLISTNVLVNNSSSGTARVINTTLTVEFSEWVGATGTSKTFKWNLGEKENVSGGDIVSFTASGATFYNLMASNCTNNPSIDMRNMESITTVITGGTEDLLNYIQVNQPSSSLAQTKPTFTNLTATNGKKVIGVFAGRRVITIYHPFYDGVNSNLRCINKASTEHLCLQLPTNAYFFCSDHQADINSGEVYVCN